MNQRKEKRRKSNAIFYDAISDRRRPGYDRRGVARAPATAGTIRPGFAEAEPGQDRRSVPGAGLE